MNNKIIFVILGFIVLIFVSNYFTYIVTGESNAPGLISVERVDFHEDREYIQITQKMLKDFPGLQDALDEVDGYTKIDPNTNKIAGGLREQTTLMLTNHMTKKIDSHLEELSTPNSKHSSYYWLEYDERYYYLGIFICFPNCPSFL